MKHYDKVYRALFPENLASFLCGDIEMPIISIDNKGTPKNFPPALVPFWRVCDGNDYIGLWKHWFIMSRQEAIVYMSSELNCKTREIARNISQLLQIQVQLQLFINQDVDEDEEIDSGMADDINSFSRAVGILDFDHLNAVVDEYADNPAGLMNLISFSQDPPVRLVINHEKYKGDFISRFDPRIDISHYCGLEIRDDLLVQFLTNKAIPWLTGGDQHSLFCEYISQGNVEKAWLSLNSSGWNYTKLRSSVEKIIDYCKDDLTKDVLVAWLSCPHDPDWRY